MSEVQLFVAREVDLIARDTQEGMFVLPLASLLAVAHL